MQMEPSHCWFQEIGMLSTTLSDYLGITVTQSPEPAAKVLAAGLTS